MKGVTVAQLRGLRLRREDWSSIDPNGNVNEHTRRTLEAELHTGPPIALFSSTDEIAPTLDWVGARLARRLELPYRGEALELTASDAPAPAGSSESAR